MNDLKPVAREIFHQALAAVDVRAAVRRHIAVADNEVTIAGKAIPLADLDRIIVIAMGKAAAPMYEAAQDVLAPTGLRLQSIVVAPGETFGDKLTGRAQFFAGSHPLPDERSAIAAQAVLDLLHTCNDRTAVLFLISGGASAMVELPLDPRISINDLRDLNRALVGSGLRIEQMNTLRKHISAVKGGRLAVAAKNASHQWTLLVSDVPDAAPDVIASGPSLPDISTLEDARSVLQSIQQKPLPSSICAGAFAETPKTGDPAFARSSSHVILSSSHLAQAAADAAAARGYQPILDNTCDEWEYTRAGDYLLQKAQELHHQVGRHCLISVGEVALALPEQTGAGGRNQHLAFWLASELARRHLPVCALSAGSDGIDGNSQAAGAVVDTAILREASSVVQDPQIYFERFDTATLFAKTGHAIVTGPTGNNLRDLRLLLVDSTEQ